MRKFLIVSGVIMLMPAVVLGAEEMPRQDSLRLYNMDEVVVTATRIPQELIRIPQRIAILPMFRYRMNPVVSAYDVLDQVSGVTLNRTMAVFSKKSVVSMRGMGNEQGRTLILIDGVPANKASSGGVNLNRINPNNIERVEIVKGPGSSLYGGNAMGGTMNVITRQYAGTMHGNASMLWGERGTFGSSICTGGSTGCFYYTVNGNYLKSNGFNNALKEERDETTISSALDQYGVDGKLGYRITPNQKIEASASYYDGSRGDGTRYFYSAPQQGQLDLMNRVREQNYRLSYQGDKGGKVWHLSGFYNQEKYTEQRAKGNTLYDVESIRRDWGAWANLHLRLTDANLLAIGAEVKGGYVDGRDHYKTTGEQMINRGKSLLMGIWAEDEIVIDNWRIVPALRFDLAHVYDGGFFVEQAASQTEIYVPYAGPIKTEWWSALSPKLSAQYLFSTNKRVFLNTGLGFRPGTLEDMTRMGPVNGGVIVPNPDLKPEHVFSTEIGGDIGLWDWLTLTSSCYYTYATDFIYSRNTGKTILMGKKERPLLQKTNAGKVSIWGIEADAYIDISDNLNFFANYAWTKAEMRQEYKGKLLPYVPKNKYALGGSWTNPIVSINMAYVQYGKQYLDDQNTQRMAAYGTVDLKLWHLFANKIQVSLNGTNLFDRRVDENGSLTPGRLIYGEVRVSF
ncbi:MAG: TonB-dependent receptor [Bacteroidales bacterium]